MRPLGIITSMVEPRTDKQLADRMRWEVQGLCIDCGAECSILMQVYKRCVDCLLEAFDNLDAGA